MILTLSAESDEQLHRICTCSAGMETGGLLIGTRDSDRAHVWAVTGPGPAAMIEERTLELDTSYMLGVIDGAALGGIVEVLGRWHKHIAPDLRASHDDRRGADAFRCILNAADSIELIIGTDRDTPIGYGAYHCTAEGLSRIHCNSLRPAGDSACDADSPSLQVETARSSTS